MVKAGQWWVSDIAGHRVLVHGVSKRSTVIVEYKDGSVGGVEQPFFSERHKHIPDCTGWDWACFTVLKTEEFEVSVE